MSGGLALDTIARLSKERDELRARAESAERDFEHAARLVDLLLDAIHAIPPPGEDGALTPAVAARFRVGLEKAQAFIAARRPT